MNQKMNVAAGARIGVIDAIRGFAILGILFANIQSWSGYKYIPYEMIATLPYYSLDGLFNALQHWVVDGKFYAIFSILFGVGFGIQYTKNEANEAPFLKGYRRRMYYLLLFGVLHALFWSGDILTLYGLLIFLLIALRKVPTPKLLLLAVGLMLWFVIPHLLRLWYAPATESVANLAHKNYPDMSPQQLIDGFGSGSWSEVFVLNLHNLYWRWIDFLPNGRISRVLGLFVLGFYLARSNYFVEQAHKIRWIAIYGIVGLILTYGAIAAGGNIHSWATAWSDAFAKLLVVGAQVILGLCYMSIIAWLYQSKALHKILQPLTLIGRMAFTNYLLHSVIGVFIFYGVGLGYFGSMGLAQLWLLALCIFIAQVVFSSLWLGYFKQGPLEWLWRCLASGKWPSNIRQRIE
ncbi:MAG: DUF418 domain-containing protein [Pseudomonadales bacterium]